MSFQGALIKTITPPAVGNVRFIEVIDKSYLLFLAWNTHLFYELTHDGTVIRSVAAPAGTSPMDGTFDGKYVYWTSNITDLCYQMDLDGVIVRTFAVVDAVTGTATDGKSLIMNKTADVSFNIYTKQGTLIRTLTSQNVGGRSLTFTGQSFVGFDAANDEFDFLTENGVLLNSVSVSGPSELVGMAFDGRIFWTADRTTALIYVFN